MFDLLTYQNSDAAISNTLWNLIDLVYPPFCCNCGTIGFEICPDCFANIQTMNTNMICGFCGSYLNAAHKCEYGDHRDLMFTQARSWGEYVGPLKSILTKIKYNRGLGLVKILVPEIAKFIRNWQITYDFITPVPLGRQRKAARGYNQSEIITRPVSKLLKKPFITDAVSRERETISQVGLTYEQRILNVKDAFTANPSVCQGRSILLCDDITTTFSTLNECAGALLEAGAANVYCFTVARAVNN